MPWQQDEWHAIQCAPDNGSRPKRGFYQACFGADLPLPSMNFSRPLPLITAKVLIEMHPWILGNKNL